MWKFLAITNRGERVHFKKGDETIHLHKTEIADAFVEYGGGFTRCLGDALYHADHINTALIINTRAGMVEEYTNKFIIPNKPGLPANNAEKNSTTTALKESTVSDAETN